MIVRVPTGESASSWVATAAREMQGQQGEQATLEAAVRWAVHNVDGAESVSVSIVSGKIVTTPAWDGTMALECDGVQYGLDEGPCLSSIVSHQTVRSPSVEHDVRWPVWGPRVARDHGAASVLAVRLFTDGDSYGALNMYSSSKDAFGDHAVEEAQALAAHVAIALATVRQVDTLMAGLDTRSIIGQAIGIVMERFDVTPVVGFAFLARLSSTHNVKIRDLAQELVTSRRLPGE